MRNGLHSLEIGGEIDMEVSSYGDVSSGISGTDSKSIYWADIERACF